MYTSWLFCSSSESLVFRCFESTSEHQDFQDIWGGIFRFKGQGSSPGSASQGASKPGTVLQLPYAEALQCIEEERPMSGEAPAPVMPWRYQGPFDGGGLTETSLWRFG